MGKNIDGSSFPNNAEEAYSDLVSGVLNLETKVIAGLTLTESPKNSSQIYESVKESVRDDGFSKSLPFAYVKDSLRDIGFAERVNRRELSNSDDLAGYKLTGYGEAVKPVLSYQLKYVADSNSLSSMNELLGSNRDSRHENWPLTTVRILESVDEQQFPTASSIAGEELSFPKVSAAAERLEERSFLERLKPFGSGDSYQYRVVDSDPKSFSTITGYSDATPATIEILEQDMVLDRYTISDELGYSDKTMSRVLGGLAKQGILEPVERFKLTGKADEALVFIKEVKDYIDYLYKDDMNPPESLIESWNQYDNDTEAFNSLYAAKCWQNCRRQSPYVNAVPKEESIERVEKVVDMIMEDGGNPLTSTIHEKHRELFGERSKKSIRERLNQSELLTSERWEEDRRKKVWKIEKK